LYPVGVEVGTMNGVGFEQEIVERFTMDRRCGMRRPSPALAND